MVRAWKQSLQLMGAGIAVAFGAVGFAQVPPPSETTPPPPPATEVQPPPAPETAAPVEAAPPPAYATPAPEAAPAPPPPANQREPYYRRHNKIFAPQEISLQTGAGVGNYFGTNAPTVDTGAAWDARVTFGARSIIALEAGYVGGVNQIDVPGTAGHLNTNGIDGDFRLQLPYRFQPYIFTGVGWNHLSVYTSDNPNVTAQVNLTDDQVAIPAGGGFAAYLGRRQHLMLDLRGTYRYIPDNGITIMGSNTLHQWTAQARIGYTF